MIDLSLFLRSVKKPPNSYLVALSTPNGIMQHTMHNLPDPEHGYATDDNARALIAAHMWKNIDRKNAELMRSLETAYLRFLKFAQTSDGTYYCHITFDLKKINPGTGDWFGRALFALAFLSYKSNKFGTASWELIHKNLPIVYKTKLSLRTTAFVILALYYILKKDYKKEVLSKIERKRILKVLRNYKKMFLRLAKNCSKKWYWPEDTITYDNGKLIQAYLILGQLLEDDKLADIGIKMLDFYTSATLKKGYFQAPGNKGWWHKGKKKPLYDEQALEAYSLTAALVTAYKHTKNNKYLKIARNVYNWFWGKNRLGVPLIDNRFGAVYDGLHKSRVNNNQGAESYLSLTLAYFALTKKLVL